MIQEEASNRVQGTRGVGESLTPNGARSDE